MKHGAEERGKKIATANKMAGLPITTSVRLPETTTPVPQSLIPLSLISSTKLGIAILSTFHHTTSPYITWDSEELSESPKGIRNSSGPMLL